MKKYTLLICISMMLLCFDDAQLSLINQTGSQIAFEYNAEKVLVDTMLNKSEYYLTMPLKIKDTLYVPEYRGSWRNFFKRSQSKKLYLFIFNFDTLKRYNDINYLVEHQLYRRLEFSEKDLEQTNWQIVLKD